jgi:hypothetical protein
MDYYNNSASPKVSSALIIYQPEVEEREPAVLGPQHVAIVGVRVHHLISN